MVISKFLLLLPTTFLLQVPSTSLLPNMPQQILDSISPHYRKASVIILVHWYPPPPNWIKCNKNGASRDSTFSYFG
ncbi:hypothetical protein TSUD_212760 [Trifolium subterraneum]|uniref:Uncharacterized protein n=1 Tax=Trifolium subterraneum TaxID=3900 RepID=A0A2Z6NDS3_TRISU|nr:hypothetical protein TSUD_212760 [Trifolium subterraneum]